MRHNRHAVRKRLTKVFALLCCVSMLVGSFAFFTDRVSQDVRASAGNIDLVFTDISSSTTGANGIRSNNEFARDAVWGSSIVRNRAVINPGDYFDLSYALMNTGSKSMDVRQQLVLTSSKPLTADAEEYRLTITGGRNATAVVGDLSGDRKSITYDLKDIVLSGSVEQEAEALADPRFVVRLDFLLDAANEFAGSGITVTYKAMAKQHRNTTDEHWANWAEYETKFDQIGEADPDEPDVITLSGDGQTFNKQLPGRLSFTAPIKSARLVEVRIDGELLDPVHYIVTGGSQTTITLNTSYLNTLDVDSHEITVVFPDVSPSAMFNVEDYKVSPGRAYILAQERNGVHLTYALLLFEDDYRMMVQHMVSGDQFGTQLTASEEMPEGTYEALLAGQTVTLDGDPMALSADGTQLTMGSTVFTAAGAEVVFDENYVYCYESITGGYSVAPLTEDTSAQIASSFLGCPVNTIAGYAFVEFPIQQSTYKVPNNIQYIGIASFMENHSLTSVDLGRGVKHVQTGAFYECSNLSTIYIPAGLETIGEEAFSGCTNLTDVYFAGTEEQWERIAIADGNDALLNATIHFDYAG